MKTKAFCFAFALVYILVIIGKQTDAQEKEPHVFLHVDHVPQYPGGNEALQTDITTILKYPKAAIKNGSTGKVHVMFTIDKTGEITNARIYKGVGEPLNKEALSAVNQLDKKWKPGKQEGKTANMSISMLFEFEKDGEIIVTPPPPAFPLPLQSEIIQVWEMGKDETVIKVAPVVTTVIESEEEADEPIVFYFVEDMPEYPGGIEALLKDFKKEVKYPKNAKRNGIYGKTYVCFVVSTNGKLCNTGIARGVNPLLDKEAIRAVNSIETSWKPGMQCGVRVNVSIGLMFDFKKNGKIDVAIMTPPEEK